MDQTLYIDESGLFVQPRNGDALHVRVVGGCMIPGLPERHDRHVVDALRRALEWWPGERHALAMRNAVKVAFALRAAARGGTAVPAPLERLAEELAARPINEVAAIAMQPGNRRRLFAEGHRLLERALHLLGELHASIVVAAEDDQCPATPRYPEMGSAVVLRALLELAARRSDGARLAVVVASGGAGGTAWTSELGDLAMLVSKRLGCRLALAGVEIVDARDDTRRPAIFLADATTHLLGPQGNQRSSLGAEQRADWNLQRLRGRVELRCGRVELMLGSGLLQAALCAWLEGTRDARALLDAIDGAQGPGHLPAVMEDLRALLPRLLPGDDP